MPKQMHDEDADRDPLSNEVPELGEKPKAKVEQASSPWGEDAPDQQGPEAVTVTGRFTDILSGPLGAIAMQNLRVRPRQVRSFESVERILSAAAAMTFDQKSASSISIEKISVGAGVTPQAAYRYFKDADELVKTGLRCVVIREHERLIAQLTARVLSDEAEMAHAVVGLVLDACDRLRRFPVHLRRDIFREYRQVGYDAALLMAELIIKDANRSDVRHRLDAFKTSVALTATIAVATSSPPKGSASLRGSEFEGMLSDLFASVLQRAGSSFDAFRELKCEFIAF